MSEPTPRERIELLVKQWQEERPDLDAQAMLVLGRIHVLARQLDDELLGLLRPYDLTIPEFDVLAVLRRCGEPFHQSMSALCAHSLVTSGTMTNRVDRLEAKGLVERRRNPGDRRGVLVALKAKGRELIDAVVSLRLAGAQKRVSDLSGKDLRLLTDLLDRLFT